MTKEQQQNEDLRIELSFLRMLIRKHPCKAREFIERDAQTYTRTRSAVYLERTRIEVAERKIT